MAGVDRGVEEEGSRFWVTCYTDASFSRTAAGWGVWLRSARGRVVRHGACPPYVRSANEAEMAAIFAGVYLARKAWGAAVRGLVVYTDSQAAVGFLSGEGLKDRIQRSAPGIVRLRERILAFSGEHRIELDLRWVKGHQRTNTRQAYLNAQCDAMAAAARGVAERGGGKERSGGKERIGVAKKGGRRPSAAERAAPVVEGPKRPSRKQRERARRLRARERKRAKKAALAAAPGPSEERSQG